MRTASSVSASSTTTIDSACLTNEVERGCGGIQVAGQAVRNRLAHLDRDDASRSETSE